MKRETWMVLGAVAGAAVVVVGLAAVAVAALRAASAIGTKEGLVEGAKSEASAATAAHERAVHLEHAIEHGRDGRARGMDQGRTPNVSGLHANAGLYPAHTRSHG